MRSIWTMTSKNGFGAHWTECGVQIVRHRMGINFEVSALLPDGDEPDTPLDVLVRQVDCLVERLGIKRVASARTSTGPRCRRRSGMRQVCRT